MAVGRIGNANDNHHRYGFPFPMRHMVAKHLVYGVSNIDSHHVYGTASNDSSPNAHSRREASTCSGISHRLSCPLQEKLVL